MRKTWLSSVAAGLLVLAPIAAVAQTAGDDVETVEDGQEEQDSLIQELDEGSEQVDTLELEDETVTDGLPEEGEDGEDGEDGAGESNDHGERVSAVARCAPTGKLDIEGFANHGAFVRAVAHGETVTVDGVDHDLSTQEGVDALCAWAESYEPAEGEDVEEADEIEEVEATSADEGDGGKPAHAGKKDGPGKPAHAGKKEGKGKPASAGKRGR